ncbi:sugar transferase [Limnohabitans sp. B9-3]|uniref:sugar transferase n=1 Tax=Limnohabitans sp. B9-3 TaxID=1100707 RepID=UPI001E623632|nr:sugar transferase [Limnohabitans sp. B9-3]
MKTPDDGTLSLFDDFPASNAAPVAAVKKPRAKRKTSAKTEVLEDVPAEALADVPVESPSAAAQALHAALPTQTPSESTAPSVATSPATDSTPTEEALQPAAVPAPAPMPSVDVEATLQLANLVPTPPKRQNPWAKAAAESAQQDNTAKPHVMLVITKGEAGGAQSHVLALCEALQSRIHFTVVIGGPEEASVLGQQLRALGVTVCPMPEMVESLNPWRLWPAIQQLTALIAATPPDLIHAHSAIAGLAARLACQRTARPVVYTVHGFGFKPEIPWLRRQMASLAERALSGSTTHMICVSKHERELAYQLPIAQERVHVIPNGIAKLATPLPMTSADEAATVDAREGSNLVSSLEESSNSLTPAAPVSVHTTKPRLIMVARMKSPKRHDVLLRALAQVRNTLGYELPISLAGDGPLRAAHEALAQELNLQEVTWLGDVNNVSELLAVHDVFVLLSDHEGMPITVLEAMRAGLGILASDLPGIREQLIPGQEGLLVANTPEAVAEQLMRLVREPYLRKRLGRAAQQCFENNFAVEHMAEQVMDVYQQCQRDDAATSRPHTDDNAVGSALVSASVRRRDALQSWTLWGAWMLPPSLFAAQLLEDAGVMTYQFGDTLWWCVLPYIVASHLLLRASHLPVAERSGVLWVSTVAPFVLTPLGFALLQQPYSRAAVLWAYVVTSLWLWWGHHRLVKHRALRLVHLDASVPAQLAACLHPQALDPRAVDLQHWNPRANTALPACDGLVLDRHVPATPERTQLLGQLKMQHLRLYSVEAVAELMSGREMLPTAADSLWEIDNDPGYDRVKRLLDLAALVVLSPLWLPLSVLVAAAVRFDSKGPALFSQQRVGRNGQLFRLWKFRSMVHGLQAPGVHFAQADDPRITRVGHFLRRTRLDELPQLWNVLRGHMSLIGPRPEQAPFVREFATTIPSYPYRHLVRPGLTGWAQVQQGYADSTDSTRLKLSYDLYYVAHYSLALDLLIAAKTVKTICTGFGAR